MRRLLTLFIVLFSISSYSQQNIIENPRVDKRVELMSIVFRLADCKEYSSKRFKTYTDDIEQYFSNYKNHELIEFVKKIRQENHVAYDAVMSMAIHLTQPPELKPIIPFNESIPDKRWGKDNAYRFVELLQKFYNDARCEDFFENHKNLYITSSDRFNLVFKELDIDWYNKFYGKNPKGNFNIIIGLGNGGGNYGPKIILPDSAETIYAILGTWDIDSLDLPKFEVDDYLPTLLHEFNHSFINYLTEKNEEKFENSGKIIYNEVESVMRGQAYGDWQTMINEALVRAAVIKYLKDHQKDETIIKQEFSFQKRSGFLWIKELEEELETYDKNRNKYITLESYIPQLINFYNETAINFDKYKKEFENNKPKVISIEQFRNGDKNVSPNIKEIKVNFDRALSGHGYSINYGKKGEAYFPKITTVKYANDNKSIMLLVDLEPSKEYQFILTGLAFKSEDGFPIEDYEISFQTSDK